MKKLFSVLLAVFLLCGCAAEKPHATTQAPLLTEPTAAPTFAETDNPVKFFSVSLGEDYENILRLDVFYNEDGSVHVEYVGDVKKVGTFDANVMHGLAEAFLQSGLTELHGQDFYGEGEANASMYVEMEDSTMYAVGFSGAVPQAFKDGYEKLDRFFAELTAELSVYVPQPLVMGEVQEDLLRPCLISYTAPVFSNWMPTPSVRWKRESFLLLPWVLAVRKVLPALSAAHR